MTKGFLAFKGAAQNEIKPKLRTRTHLVDSCRDGDRTGGGTATAKPNILVINGGRYDIGYWNISAYNRGMMGYHTPNIDRIANEGAIFTDYYGQQSCTAGRAAFITGQSPLRTGLPGKWGCQRPKRGCPAKTRPSQRHCSSREGYATAQFGKNHLGERNEFLHRPSTASTSSSAASTI